MATLRLDTKIMTFLFSLLPGTIPTSIAFDTEYTYPDRVVYLQISDKGRFVVANYRTHWVS